MEGTGGGFIALAGQELEHNLEGERGEGEEEGKREGKGEGRRGVGVSK